MLPAGQFAIPRFGSHRIRRLEALESAELGIQRPDVANALRRFASASSSGFTFVTDGTELAGAESKIKVVARAVGGLTREDTIPLRHQNTFPDVGKKKK